MGPSGSLAVLVVCMVCGGASAVDMSKVQPYNLTALVMFAQEDLDQDGVMTVAEIEGVFAKYNTDNHPETVSRHEYTTMICSADPDLYQLSHYLYDDYDVNGDHHLEISDFDAWHAKIDGAGDGNGMVTQDEFVNYWVKLFQTIEGQAPVHGHSHEHGHCATG